MKRIAFLFTLCSYLFFSCEETVKTPSTLTNQYLVVLGIAQDAGYPQAGCQKQCCQQYWEKKQAKKYVTSLGIVDKTANKIWLLEATPDFVEQWQILQKHLPNKAAPDGIFLTHAHIGHYTGLMHLGHEVMGAKGVNTYVMPRMKSYLETNGPWSQLVDFQNINLQLLAADSTIVLTENLEISPFLVPHRDEFSETVGYRIKGKNQSILFIPDIDKWHKWSRNIATEIEQVDIAFLDGTFYENGELPNRDMSQIPHPFVMETMALLDSLPDEEKQKVHFIHLNHTNRLLWEDKARSEVQAKGFELAQEGAIIEL